MLCWRRHRVWFLLAMVLLFVLPVLWWAIQRVNNEAKLRVHAEITCAEVTERDVRREHGRVHHWVRYAFPFRGSRYSASNETGMENLWVSLNGPDWSASLTSGCVEIVFLARNPWVNRPRNVGDDRADVRGAFLLSAILLFLWLLEWLRDRKTKS